jgi:alanine racemase
MANSAGMLRLAELEGADAGHGLSTQAVRPGLLLYGVSPFMGPGAVIGRSAEALGLEPVMTHAARGVAPPRVAKGASVGYGATWRAARATTIATLPLGYADGIPRAAAGRGATVYLAGAARPIVGRVSMDYVGVDVGDAPVAVGQVGTVFGRSPDGVRVPVEDFASAADTLGYEILVGVGARVPRRSGEGPPPAEPEDLDPAV